ncbi:hypothetical protein BDQ17DRAFT_1324499 [Cyathus striatus]|nr:hypothetical protein BDQ17DRAFT_1324499 [Cyathus striatus]
MDTSVSTSSPSHLRPGNTSRPSGHRRTPVACLNCRNRKVRCDTTDSERLGRCKRCVEHNYKCEFLTVADEQNRRSRASSMVPGDSEARQDSSYSNPIFNSPSIAIPQGPPFDYRWMVVRQPPSTGVYPIHVQFPPNMTQDPSPIHGASPQQHTITHNVGTFVPPAPFPSDYALHNPHYGTTFPDHPPSGVGMHQYYDPNAGIDNS